MTKPIKHRELEKPGPKPIEPPVDAAERKSSPARAAKLAKANTRDMATPTPLEFVGRPGESNREIAARKMVGPFTRHGLVAAEACSRFLANFSAEDRPGLVEFSNSVKDHADHAATGALTTASELLMAQALSLDSIFTEYARIALVNIASNVDASDRYIRLAMKAQTGSRAALEALARLHQPREQTVRHVHVNEGGQAIVADEFHTHTGGAGNGRSNEQPQATPAEGARKSPALPSPDPVRIAVPVSGRGRSTAMSNARRQGKRRTNG